MLRLNETPYLPYSINENDKPDAITSLLPCAGIVLASHLADAAPLAIDSLRLDLTNLLNANNPLNAAESKPAVEIL
jgi:hypothetical protein